MTSQLVVSKILGKQPVTLQSSKESVRKFTEYLKKKFLSGAGISETSSGNARISSISGRKSRIWRSSRSAATAGWSCIPIQTSTSSS